MINNTYLRLVLSVFVLTSVFTVSVPRITPAQTAKQPKISDELGQKLQVIEQKLEVRRKELGIPGLSLVIVKDDRIIFMKGFGYKDFERKIAVTPNTEFAIGSSTKAFTALSVLMSEDEGKLSVDESPKKYLSYFKINDPDTDKNITIRDLLSHSSGLNRTDLALATGKLNREELIRVAGEAKPTARLREKWQYQNLMFVAAGEIVARVQKEPWEQFVTERILKPLGMNNTNFSIQKMQTAKDFSFGYDYNFDTKETRRLPMRDLGEIAPAGAINSSARDMAQWLRLVLNRGELNGKRFVSEKGFDEWIRPQMKISDKSSYGFGWFLQNWNGLKVIQHGGNIDGFNALVAAMPDKKLGFVMLTNVSASTLGAELMPLVWENIVGIPPVPAIENKPSVAARELLGEYQSERNAAVRIQIVEKEGRASLVVKGQQPYELREKEKDLFWMSPLPEDYNVKPRRDANGKLMGVTVIQPNGEFLYKRVENAANSNTGVELTVDELMSKVIAALGGAENWKKLKSRVTTSDINFVHQGVRGSETRYAKAPNMAAGNRTITAFGKTIATSSNYFNGVSGGDESSFSPPETFTGKQLEDRLSKSGN